MKRLLLLYFSLFFIFLQSQSSKTICIDELGNLKSALKDKIVSQINILFKNHHHITLAQWDIVEAKVSMPSYEIKNNKNKTLNAGKTVQNIIGA